MSGGQEKVREWKRRKKFLLVFWAEHMFHLNHELVNKSISKYTLVQGDIYANNFPLYTRFVDILSSNVMQNSKAVQWENTTVLVDILRLFLLPVFLVFKIQYPVWLMHVYTCTTCFWISQQQKNITNTVHTQHMYQWCQNLR